MYNNINKYIKGGSKMKAKYSSKICILIILVVAILSLSNNVFAATITKEKLQENIPNNPFSNSWNLIR